MFRRIFFTGHLYLWTIWLVLLAIYVDTVIHTGTIQNAIIVLVLLVILYFAEGMEIAVATLADKQLSQLESVPAKKALQFIKRDAEWFFAQRQVFVVTIVSFMSLMTTFPAVYVPFYRSISSGDFSISLASLTIPVDVPFWFTLIFTSFTILWWCQVFPKRLALRNSEIFLHQSAKLMWPIRWVGSANLPGPADQLVWVAAKYTSFKQLSNLKPSRGYYYDTGVMLYGFAIDRAAVEVSMDSSGSAVISQKALLLFVHGRRSSATGTILTDSPFTTMPNVVLKELYSCPLPEKLELIAPQLDNIFEQGSPNSEDFTRHDLRTIVANYTFEPPAPSPTAKSVTWSMNWGAPLPNRLIPSGVSPRDNPILAALLYEITTPFDQGAFLKDDYFNWTSETPCRRFTFRVKAQPGCPLTFSINRCEATSRKVPFVDEAARLNETIQNRGLSDEFELSYPMQGTSYKILWEGW